MSTSPLLPELPDASVPLNGPSEDELRALREELSDVHGDGFWQRLEALSETTAFRSFLLRWFPSQAGRFGPDSGRRGFLRTMGASLATMGLGACTRQPTEVIVPYAARPETLIPGRPRYFATALPRGRDALGVLVESHMNRPTKVEGNPDHPASQGATDAIAQAAILDLYDPDRSHSVLRAGQISTWADFLTDLTGRLEGLRARRGAGLALLLEESSSPTLGAQLAKLQEALPNARVHRWSPLHRDEERRAARSLFGRDLVALPRFDRARIVVSLGSDFLASGSQNVRNARDFARARRGRADSEDFNRLYVVEGSVSLTGAMADHRLAVRPSRVEAFARLLAEELGGNAGATDATDEERSFARAVAGDLSSNAGAGVIVAGPEESWVVHALAHQLNEALGNLGKTVELVPPVSEPAGPESLRSLVESMRAGHVSSLLMLGGNPLYDAPASLGFRAAFERVGHRVHVSTHVVETTEVCHWHVPLAHALESWSDVRSADGTTSIVQPLIAPLYGGRTLHEVLAVLSGVALPKSYDIVREHWRVASGLEGDAFEQYWRTALHDGVLPGTRAAPVHERPSSRFEPPAYEAAEGFELALRADASVLDGRYAGNAWLQELPRPISRLTWDNALLLSPTDASALRVASGDVVRIAIEGSEAVEAPAHVLPGHPIGSGTLHLGYGRRRAGALGTGVGVNAYPLRTDAEAWRRASVEIARTGRRYELASVQDHRSMEGRDLVREATFAHFKRDPEHAAEPELGTHDVSQLSLYAAHPYEGYKWGMVIDLGACIGCNACMIACQAENNVPVVGKEEVARGREMHWIRVDSYLEDSGVVRHQPVPCMQCEQAPCEVVCPVGATVHSSEGLNDMVYNRCVGTRYCSNNCPYKVRRFNFFHYSDSETESLTLASNPDVSVRSRGVMEKCTYCVQRISAARITAKKEGRDIADGDVVSACMQVCPTQAIVFGDLNDPAAAVSRAKAEPHEYGLLEELGTRPRTTYLARLSNPNPDLEPA